ncbi:MAG: hypothetical protein ACK559_06680, partial [bacterium]
MRMASAAALVSAFTLATAACSAFFAAFALVADFAARAPTVRCGTDETSEAAAEVAVLRAGVPAADALSAATLP